MVYILGEFMRMHGFTKKARLNLCDLCALK
jgi:hypothetical protein